MRNEGKMSRAERGKWGEEIACDFLVKQGYGILEQNWKMNHYEIDIIAQQGTDVVFVEVKTRDYDSDDPVSAVNNGKRARLVSVANAYMQKFNVPMDYRFDIIAISGSPADFSIEHIIDAFVPALKRINFSFKL